MPTHTPQRQLTAAEVTNLLEVHFPQIHQGNGRVVIDAITTHESIVRMQHDDSVIRPGGTISGPAMFKLADLAVYVAILARLGEGGLQAVTTNMSINFMSRPQPGDILAHARLMKLGRRLAVAEAAIYAEGDAQMVAHAVSTYALPPTVK